MAKKKAAAASLPPILAIPERWTAAPVRVALVGVGGTGSQMADQLASMHVTLRQLGHPGFEVTVFDADRVSRPSLGRSRYCEADIHNFKALVLCHRISLFYGTHWRAVCAHAAPNDLHGFDCVVTCTDSAAFRVRLADHFRRQHSNALWCDTGNANANGQVIIGHLGQPNGAHKDHRVLRIPNVVDLHAELRGEAGRIADADDVPSCSTEQAIQRQDFPVNRIAATLAAEMLWTLIRHGQLTHHGVYFRLNPMQTTPLAIDPAAWEFFGYRNAAA